MPKRKKEYAPVPMEINLLVLTSDPPVYFDIEKIITGGWLSQFKYWQDVSVDESFAIERYDAQTAWDKRNHLYVNQMVDYEIRWGYPDRILPFSWVDVEPFNLMTHNRVGPEKLATILANAARNRFYEGYPDKEGQKWWIVFEEVLLRGPNGEKPPGKDMI